MFGWYWLARCLPQAAGLTFVLGPCALCQKPFTAVKNKNDRIDSEKTHSTFCAPNLIPPSYVYTPADKRPFARAAAPNAYSFVWRPLRVCSVAFTPHQLAHNRTPVKQTRRVRDSWAGATAQKPKIILLRQIALQNDLAMIGPLRPADLSTRRGTPTPNQNHRLFANIRCCKLCPASARIWALTILP